MILLEVIAFTDPAPQKLVNRVILKVTIKKSDFHHSSFDRQTAICIEKQGF